MNRNLGFFTTGYNYLIQIIPTLIVAPLFIRGEVEFGVITQSAMAFAQLLGAFSLIVNQFQSISSFAAVIARLERAGRGRRERAASARPAVPVVEAGERIAYEGLTLFSPEDGRALLRDLTADIPRGTRVLVVRAERGRADRPVPGDRRGLARRGRDGRPAAAGRDRFPARATVPAPRDSPGSPRPHRAGAGHPDDRITTVLHDAGLDCRPGAGGGLDREHDWPAILSLGEQQLLAVTRLILARPAFAMLDRVTATLRPAQVRRRSSVSTKTPSPTSLSPRRRRIGRAVRRGAGDRRRRHVELETDRPRLSFAIIQRLPGIARRREILYADGTAEEKEALEDALYALHAFKTAWQHSDAA